MPSFKIVDDVNSIQLPSNWKDSEKFISKNRLVDEFGKPVSSNYQGSTYRIILKKEYHFSLTKRIVRGMKGTIALIVTFGLAIFRKPVRDLFTKEKATCRFAVSAAKNSTSLSHAISFNKHFKAKEQPFDVSKVNVMFSTNDKKEGALFKKLDAETFKMYEQQLNENVNISQEAIDELKGTLSKIAQEPEPKGVVQHHKQFTLEKAPGYLFKLDCPGSKLAEGLMMKTAYENMVAVKSVCQLEKFDQLVVPNAKMIKVEACGVAYDVVAIKQVDVDSSKEAQEFYFDEYGSSLDEAVKQLVSLVCKTGLKVYLWDDFPVLNQSFDEKGQRKIVLNNIVGCDSYVNFSFFGNFFQEGGLINCLNEEQGKMMKKIAEDNHIDLPTFDSAFERRKKVLQENQKMKEFYHKKALTHGKEPITVDVESLGLDLSEVSERKYFSDESKEETIKMTLKDFAELVVKEINTSIQNKPDKATMINKRRLLLSTSNEPFVKYQWLGLPSDQYAFDRDDREKSWLYLVIKALEEKGYIYSLLGTNGHGFVIQA